MDAYSYTHTYTHTYIEIYMHYMPVYFAKQLLPPLRCLLPHFVAFIYVLAMHMATWVQPKKQIHVCMVCRHSQCKAQSTSFIRSEAKPDLMAAWLTAMWLPLWHIWDLNVCLTFIHMYVYIYKNSCSSLKHIDLCVHCCWKEMQPMSFNLEIEFKSI